QALSDQQRAETALTHAEQSQARAVKATEELMAKSRKLSEFLARQAIRAAEEGRFAEAEVRADTAIKIAEKSPWGFFAMGAVFQIQQRSGRARKWLTQALEIDPDHTPSQLALSDLDKNEEQITGAEGLIQNPAKATDWRDFDKSGDLFMSAKKFREAENAYNLGLLKMQQTKSVKDHDRNELAFKHEDARAWKLSEGFYKTIQHLPEDAQRSRIRLKVNEIHGYQVGCNPKFENGIVESVWFGQNVKHLHVLRGMELKWLNIGSRPSIRSLEPLRGMPLKALMIQFTDVRDLSPLTGMPLEHLDSVNNVSDISPLRGMPLKKLVAPRGVRDFSPIEGMPLEEVSFYANTGVYNIDFLKGMRLRKISLPPSVREVSPLRGMPLEQIDVLLAHRYDVDFLRETKTLKKINKMPAEEFWQKIDDYRARIANKAKEEEDERLAQIKAARPEGWQFEVRTIPDLGIELVHLPSGSFMMGATNGPDDEKPVHKVTISRPFWMAKTELTQKQYQSLTGKNPSRFKGDNRPVESLFWGSAFNYCKVLTNRERRAGKVPPGYVYRLPSEAEWEYACRAGTRTDWYFGGKEHYKEHVVPMAFPGSKKTTRDVGSLKPNPWDSMTCTAASKSSASTAAIDEA
ncbi:MAG: SUMF1/EgtB/PvdO family nonheme iron enzyme, partial [Planctomycetota bacterium]|nr:SUMF1/EgtB/PvdO family nonheme iron enzyme [Planctomycetota bacterium]